MKLVSDTPEHTGGFSPIKLLEVELSGRIPSLPAVDPETGRRYTTALSLVRLHSQPLGLVRVPIGESGLPAAEYARRIWAELRPELLEHLSEDGLEMVAVLEPEGLPGTAHPRCGEERERVLEHGSFVSVVVPTHDRPELIRSCVAALAALEYPRYEIIVVDNAPSTGETAGAIEDIAKLVPNLRYIREDRPGASWARNRGLAQARGEIVAFTDDDVAVDQFWLAEMVKAFGAAENVGCVTGNVLPRELETPAQAWFEERGGFSRGFAQRVYDTDKYRSDHPLFPYSAMMFGSGNSMAFRASLLRTMGGFDPALDPASPSRGGEDLAAFFEVVVRGYQIVYEPAAIVRHLHRRDLDGLRRQMNSWGVGFAAYLARSLMAHPRLLPDFGLKLPYAMTVFLKGKVPYGLDQARRLDETFPAASTRDLWNAEYSGYLTGVFAYLRSLQHVRRVSRRFRALRVGAVTHSPIGDQAPREPDPEKSVLVEHGTSRD